MGSGFRVETKKAKRWYSTVLIVFCISLPYILLLARFRGKSEVPGGVSPVRTAVDTLLKDESPQQTSCDLSLKESNGFFCEPDSVWRRRRTIFARQELKQINNQYSPGGYEGHSKFSKHLSQWWQQNYEVCNNIRRARSGTCHGIYFEPYMYICLSNHVNCNFSRLNAT